MSTLIAITLSAYILGCIAAFAINLYENRKYSYDRAETYVSVIISIIGSIQSWAFVVYYRISKTRNRRKHAEK